MEVPDDVVLRPARIDTEQNFDVEVGDFASWLEEKRPGMTELTKRAV